MARGTVGSILGSEVLSVLKGRGRVGTITKEIYSNRTAYRHQGQFISAQAASYLTGQNVNEIVVRVLKRNLRKPAKKKKVDGTVASRSGRGYAVKATIQGADNVLLFIERVNIAKSKLAPALKEIEVELHRTLIQHFWISVRDEVNAAAVKLYDELITSTFPDVQPGGRFDEYSKMGSTGNLRRAIATGFSQLLMESNRSGLLIGNLLSQKSDTFSYGKAIGKAEATSGPFDLLNINLEDYFYWMYVEYGHKVNLKGFYGDKAQENSVQRTVMPRPFREQLKLKAEEIVRKRISGLKVEINNLGSSISTAIVNYLDSGEVSIRRGSTHNLMRIDQSLSQEMGQKIQTFKPMTSGRRGTIPINVLNIKDAPGVDDLTYSPTISRIE